MATSSNKTWELPAGLADYINRYMSHYINNKKVKEKILMENPVSSNIKGTPNLDNYIKELLLENKRKLILNHGETLKGIYDKVNHVFSHLLRLWSIMEEEKDAALQELSENNKDSSPVLVISSLFEQSILLLGQVF